MRFLDLSLTEESFPHQASFAGITGIIVLCALYMCRTVRVTKGLTLAEGELLIIAVRTPKA